MRCPQLHELPKPPAHTSGWPWTEESQRLPETMPDGQPWPCLSVVTPSFNQGQFIEATVRSVLLQGYPNLEYFVLDAASTDNSVAILQRYAPWLTYWASEPDGGQSEAINRGLQMASGVFATWINSDDMLCKDALVTHASRIGFAPQIVYAGICAYMDAGGTVDRLHRGRVHSLEDLVRISTVWRARGNLVQPEVLFPRELALAVGGLNTDNHHTMDYELWGKLLLAGASIQYTDIPFAMFREHAAQKTRDGWLTTQSLLSTAARLVADADCFSATHKADILAELEAYRHYYLQHVLPGPGRLENMGLPPGVILQLRKWHASLQKLTRRFGSVGQAP